MPDFVELYTDFEDLEGLPQWMQELWEDVYSLHDGLRFWADDNGEPAIGRIIDEFQTSSHAYIRAGVIAHNVRLRGLYQKVANSFTAFCDKWLGQSVWMVNRTIAAANVAIKLMAWGFNEIPANESQCRPLARLNDDDLLEVWRTVCRAIPQKDRTAQRIEAIANRLYEVDPDFQSKPAAKRIQLNAEQWAVLQQNAARYKMSPEKYLDLMIRRDLADEPPPEPEPEPEPKPKKRKGKGKNWDVVKALGKRLNAAKQAIAIPSPT